jgi:hypothetical protein
MSDYSSRTECKDADGEKEASNDTMESIEPMNDKYIDEPKTKRGLYFSYSKRTELKDADGKDLQSLKNINISDDDINKSKDVPARLASFVELFRCADAWDMFYIRIAFVMSAISGCNQPVQLIIFGRYHILMYMSY